MPIVGIGGLSQMTPAQQMVVRQAAGGTARASGKKVRRSRKKKAAAPRAKKAKARTKKKSKKLVKGSAEAKRRMAMIRRSKNPMG